MCATGSGKTLIMHMNILQFLHYFKRAKRMNSKLSINKVIVLAPNEGMSNQHLEELALSSIPAAMFQKDRGFTTRRDDVIVIDMNKLKEEGKIKTVSVDSFEQNNLVEFYKTIKELETRLAPTADGKTVVLNSFIMSGTPASQLRQWWLMERPQREEKNVYTLDNPECVELMIDKILGK